MKRNEDNVFYALDDGKLLALLSYGEARGESKEGRIAVMNVVKNRVMARGWFLDSDIINAGFTDYHAAILKNAFILKTTRFIYQFSCFQENDPNRKHLIDIANSPVINKFIDTDTAWSIIHGDIEDNTSSATYYANMRICNPTWAASFIKCAEIGNHTFFKEGK
jgi:N-acetylmuramoyl-L-alanine amidase